MSTGSCSIEPGKHWLLFFGSNHSSSDHWREAGRDPSDAGCEEVVGLNSWELEGFAAISAID